MPGSASEFCAGILKFSRLMLASAQAGSWDDLIAQDAERQKIIDGLKRHMEAAGTPLSPGERAKAAPMIQEILELDEETATLAAHRMADIKESLSSLGVTKQLRNAYLRT